MSVSEAEAQQVIDAREGNKEAFAELVKRHWARLVRLARSIVGETAAEDAVQEGLILAWSKLDSLREPGAFGFWLQRIVLRHCLHEARKLKPWISLDTLTEPPKVAAANPYALEVEQVLTHLAPQQRAVMHLTVVEGMTDSEIGAVLNLRPSSVRSHRRRARESLSRWLEKEDTKRWLKTVEHH
jgi:RNA polymerase sigma-70 factor (ECF subfamily)